MTSEDIQELQKRDAHAQEHIPKLESENAELRDRVVELENDLANSTRLDEAVERIQQQKGDNVDPTDVASIVNNVLDQRQTQDKQERNWADVMSQLTNTYGDWETADRKVQDKSRELDISLEDATSMARNNPKAFLSLFVPASEVKADNTSGVRSGGAGQAAATTVNTSGEMRDQAYYTKLRRENPNKYWSVDTQAQMRRDLFDA